jgi:hypothetical protein
MGAGVAPDAPHPEVERIIYHPRFADFLDARQLPVAGIRGSGPGSRVGRSEGRSATVLDGDQRVDCATTPDASLAMVRRPALRYDRIVAAGTGTRAAGATCERAPSPALTDEE